MRFLPVSRLAVYSRLAVSWDARLDFATRGRGVSFVHEWTLGIEEGDLRRGIFGGGGGGLGCCDAWWLSEGWGWGMEYWWWGVGMLVVGLILGAVFFEGRVHVIEQYPIAAGDCELLRV